MSQDYCLFVGGPNDGERRYVARDLYVCRAPSRGDVEGYTYDVTAYNELRFIEYVHGDRKDYRIFTTLSNEDTLKELLGGFVLSNGRPLPPSHTLFVVKGEEGKTQFVSVSSHHVPENPKGADGYLYVSAGLLGLKMPSHVNLGFEQRPISKPDGRKVVAFMDSRLTGYNTFLFDYILDRYKKVT